MSMQDPHQREESHCALRNVRLTEQDDKILAQSAPDAEPLQLPFVAKALTDWLAVFGMEFLKRTGRCVAAVLLLDPASGEWRIAIPHQRCSREASCWVIRSDDFSAVSRTACIGGSFQVRVLSPGEQPADAVPSADGLHLILHVRGEVQTIWPFLRLRDEVRLVPANDVILDDMSEALERTISKVQLL